jgi:short-subunit dehydrogenase
MRKVIIIGATSGIGLELARLYVANGDHVGISGRRTELLNEIKSSIPAKLETECFDVIGNDNVLHLKSLIKKLGGLDILIYNSGYGEPSKELDLHIEQQTTRTNVNGFVEIVNFAFSYFTTQGHGAIAATSSIASIRGNSWAPAYSASKAFMSTYMEGLHIKAGRMKLKIVVTDIQPGFVKTKMAKSDQLFWVAPVEKAARQIFRAIEKKKRRVYVTRRWWLIAKILKWLPYFVYKRIG